MSVRQRRIVSDPVTDPAHTQKILVIENMIC